MVCKAGKNSTGLEHIVDFAWKQITKEGQKEDSKQTV